MRNITRDNNNRAQRGKGKRPSAPVCRARAGGAQNALAVSALKNISRETLADFEHWFALLNHWNQRINLVSASTLENFWIRHALDSWQLTTLVPDTARAALDMGSGAGFPGMALAIAAKNGILPNLSKVRLVEANGKKCNFLRTAARELNVPVEISQARLEDVRARRVDILTARALAPLDRLLDYSLSVTGVDEDGTNGLKTAPVLLFPKGENWEMEVRKAQKRFTFNLEAIPSQTNPNARILRLTNARIKGKARL